tara:strand:- start:3217 stop:5364 length:2148 start_codon:yes stop_codon:yes gene_type:complete
MANIRDSLEELAKKTEEAGLDSTHIRENIRVLDEQAKQQLMNPNFFQKTGNFVRKLGNIPNMINQNFAGFLNPSPTEEDFNFIPDKQKRLQALKLAQLRADQQSDFNKTLLGLSALQVGAPRTTPGLDYTPLTNAVATINQNMTNQRRLAPELAYNNMMRPLQMAKVIAETKAANRKGIPLTLNSATGEIQSISGGTNAVGTTGVNTTNVTDNIVGTTPVQDKTSQVSQDFGITTPVGKDFFAKRTDLFPRKLSPFISGDKVSQDLALDTKKKFDDNLTALKSTENFFASLNKDYKISTINPTDFAQVFDIYTNPQSEQRTTSLNNIKTKLLQDFDTNNYSFLPNSAFETFANNNQRLFNFNKDNIVGDTDKQLAVRQLNILKTNYDKNQGYDSVLRGMADEFLKQDIEALQLQVPFRIDDFDFKGGANVINDWIQKNIIESPRPKLDTLPSDENIIQEFDDPAITDNTIIEETGEDGKLYTVQGLKEQALFKKDYKTFNLKTIFNDAGNIDNALKHYVKNINMITPLRGDELTEQIATARKYYREDIGHANQKITQLSNFKKITDKLQEYVDYDDDGNAIPSEKLRKITTDINVRGGSDIESLIKKGTNVKELQAFKSLLTQLEAHVFLDELENLKYASERGSTGMGSLSNQEGGTIKSTIGNLGITRDDKNKVTIQMQSGEFMADVLNEIIQNTENTEMSIVSFFKSMWNIDL